jgi:hypothetical protein
MGMFVKEDIWWTQFFHKYADEQGWLLCTRAIAIRNTGSPSNADI